MLGSLRQHGRSGTRKAPSLADGLEGGVRELIKQETDELARELEHLREQHNHLARLVDNSRALLTREQRDLYVKMAQQQADTAAVVAACAQMPKMRDLDSVKGDIERVKRELVERIEDVRVETVELVRVAEDRNLENFTKVHDNHDDLVRALERIRLGLTKDIAATDEEVKALRKEHVNMADLYWIGTDLHSRQRLQGQDREFTARGILPRRR